MSTIQQPDALAITTVVDRDQEKVPIPLASRILHKFYEPIILYVSLNDATRGTAQAPPPEPAIDTSVPKEVFEAFVNKLAHICDKTKGGDSVTAFTVLNNDEENKSVHYLFAANRQSIEQLQSTLSYVNELLRKVSNAPDNAEQQHAVRKNLLYDVLCFNRLRISHYLGKLQFEIEECLKSCGIEDTEDSIMVATELKKLHNSNNSGISLNSSKAECTLIFVP
ncbi:hypothetical protein NKR23_g11518 [Pleurostoma richardsiae]|uniref:Uncharacterized protein n=1 Tax=Pleurostoma richardsiae TaxID=41990 RepID=A0AA38R2X3_9PEZI|nr:hypothetical protein NKR23_g11518 [Pleurostoma richardsiae]